jgi:hypothetical protein
MPLAPEVIDTLVRVLSPYVGENMARAAVRSQTDKLGLAAGRLSPADVDRLLAAIAPGLGVFVGRDKTEKILDEARTAVNGRGAGR